jgi:hypothetical protein
VDAVEPSLSATFVVSSMPEGEWLTEDQITALPWVEAVLKGTGRRVRSALGEARRRGWVIRNPTEADLRWARTPKGAVETSRLREKAESS